MKLRLVRNVVFAAIIGVLAVSCMEDNTYEEYVPPTKAEEQALLTEYLDTLQNRGLDIDTTSLGVYYIVDSIGNGTFPVIGDTCTVNYTGFFIGGDIFDTGDNFEFVLEDGSFIEGWIDGMQVIDEGAEVYLIVPSDYAYGLYGYSSVPPNTSLIFHIEMVDIKLGL